MKLNPRDLAKVSDLTLDHHNARAERFWAGTRDYDVALGEKRM